MTFFGRIKRDYRIIKENLKTRVVWKFYLYWLLAGLEPKFPGPNYVWIKTSLGISDIQYGVIAVVTSVALLFGVVIYQNFLKAYELRSLMYLSILVRLFSYSAELLLFHGINLDWGISNVVFLCFGSALSEAFDAAMVVIPTIVVFQKITPAHVETTMMALGMSVINASNGLISFTLGVAINQWFVGVDADNDQDYYILIYIQMVTVLWELVIIRLIPVQ